MLCSKSACTNSRKRCAPPAAAAPSSQPLPMQLLETGAARRVGRGRWTVGLAAVRSRWRSTVATAIQAPRPPSAAPCVPCSPAADQSVHSRPLKLSDLTGISPICFEGTVEMRG
eukprot:COSAG05_NODE_1303_length_5240_cov_2.158335_1_plen_114_part_00